MTKENLLFTKHDVWNGGNIDLEIFCPDCSLAKATSLFTALWTTSIVSGCYLERTIEPENQTALFPDQVEMNTTCYGYLTILGTKRVACCGTLMDYDNYEDGYWVNLWIPLGSISRVYDTQAYPFGSKKGSHLNWLKDFVDILKNIALEVNEKEIFDFAVIGNEPFGVELYEKAKKGIPEERNDGYLVREDEKLIWYPPTKYGPNASFDNANL